jgi:hypothetical protein
MICSFCSVDAMAERACFNCGTVDCWSRFRKVHSWFIYLLIALLVISIGIMWVQVDTGVALFLLAVVCIVINLSVPICCRGYHSDVDLETVIRRDELTTVRWMLRKGELSRPRNKDVSLNDTTNLEMMHVLIDGGVSLDDEGRFLVTPLNNAVSKDNLPMARLLLERGADVNYKGAAHQHRRGAPIFAAVSAQMARLLVEAGADLTGMELGQSLIEHAASKRDVGVLEYLIQATKDKGIPLTCVLLHHAGSPANARVLVAQLDSNIDADTPNGSPAICAASYRGDVNVMRFLVACGVEVDAEGHLRRANETVFTARMMCRSKEVASILLAAGAQKGRCPFEPSADEIAEARRRIARERVDLIRARAFEVCVALESLELPALVMCEILEFACAPFAACVPFHHKWDIVVAVKHHESSASQWSSARSRSQSSSTDGRQSSNVRRRLGSS